MADNLGASFSIDVTNLKAGLAQANRLIRESESEFKAAAAGMEDWSGSQEGLEAKIKSLNSITEIQRKKVDALQQEYDNLISDGLDPASREATELRTKINNETAALNRNEAELKRQIKALDEMQNSADDAADSVEDTGEAAKKAADGFTIGKGAIATFIGNGLTALVGACKNAISALAGLASESREYREDMGKLATGFETAGYSAETAKDIYSDFYSVLGESDRSVEAVNHLAQLTDNQKDLAKWSDICAGVVGTFGDSLPIEGLTEAANETAKVGKVTGPLADALNWAGISEDAFNEKLAACNSEQERAQLITDTLNDTYAEAAEKYKEVNKSVMEANAAQQRFTDAQADLGAKIEPATTAVREGFAKILEKLVELTSSVDMEAFADKISGAFDSFINDVLPKITEGFQWIIDNKDALIAGIGGIGAAFVTMNVANMIMGVVNAFKAFKAAQEGATIAQWLLNAAMSANPIGLIIAAIAGLVTAFVLLWNNCEGFRNFWIGLWDSIKSVAASVADWFVSAWGTVVSFLKSIWEPVKDFFVDLWNGIIESLQPVIENIRNAFSVAWSAIKAVWSTVTGYFAAVWNTIKGIFSVVESVLKGDFQGAWNAIKGILDEWAGFFSGVWEDIKGVFSDAVDVGSKIVDDIKSGISDAWEGLKSWFTGIWDSLFGNLSANVSVSQSGGGIAATPAKNGLEYVPYDEFPALLHKGERVLTAEENAAYSKLESGASGRPVIINQYNTYSQAHSRYELYKSKQQTAAAVKLAMMGAG